MDRRLDGSCTPACRCRAAARAEAVAIPMKDALGWLVAIGGGHHYEGVGPSVLWLGRAALEGVRLAARGAVLPSLRVAGRSENGLVDANVQWVPALVDRNGSQRARGGDARRCGRRGWWQCSRDRDVGDHRGRRGDPRGEHRAN